MPGAQRLARRRVAGTTEGVHSRVAARSGPECGMRLGAGKVTAEAAGCGRSCSSGVERETTSAVDALGDGVAAGAERTTCALGEGGNKGLARTGGDSTANEKKTGVRQHRKNERERETEQSSIAVRRE